MKKYSFAFFMGMMVMLGMISAMATDAKPIKVYPDLPIVEENSYHVVSCDFQLQVAVMVYFDPVLSMSGNQIVDTGTITITRMPMEPDDFTHFCIEEWPDDSSGND